MLTVDVRSIRQDGLPRIYAAVFGAAYLLAGLVGLVEQPRVTLTNVSILTRFEGGFEVNTLHDLVHIVIGLLGFYALWRGKELLYARGMSLVFAVLSVAGFLPQPVFHALMLGGSDLFLHGITAILGDATARMASGDEIKRLEAEVGVVAGAVTTGEPPKSSR